MNLGQRYVLGADGNMYLGNFVVGDAQAVQAARNKYANAAQPRRNEVVPARRAEDVMRILPYPAPGDQPAVPYPVFGDDPAEIAMLNQQRDLQMQLQALQAQNQIAQQNQALRQQIVQAQYGGAGEYDSSFYSKPGAAGANFVGAHGSDAWANIAPFSQSAVAAGAAATLTYIANKPCKLVQLTTLTGGASFVLTDAKINGTSFRENLSGSPQPLSFYDIGNTKRTFLAPWAAKNDRIELFVRNITGAPADISLSSDVIETLHDPARIPPGVLGTILTLIAGSR